MNEAARDMRAAYESEVLPQFESEHGSQPEDGPAVHRAMRRHSAFRLFSALRFMSQEMKWGAVIDSTERQVDRLNRRAEALVAGAPDYPGSLELDTELEVPEYVRRVDIHLMPGSYYTEYCENDVAAGSMYDYGLVMSAFGAMGRDLDDIGWSMANVVRKRFPGFEPHSILDVGCTVGHNTLPWKSEFPDAEVHGVDVAAACLRYAHARAIGFDLPVHFRQASAESLPYETGSFDVVFSSMFLHELPAAAIAGFLGEANRVLRKGGVLINMELPPNAAMGAYEGFYLDWDCYYNHEPFYKAFRDKVPKDLCVDAGFDAETCFEVVVPRYTYVDEAEFSEAAVRPPRFGKDTGRLSHGITWYGFGAVK
jgi:SAM-dependent methyltransferase